MTIAKIQYQTGNLQSFYFERMPGGWLVYFILKTNPTQKSYLIDSRRKERKLFKSLDSAVSSVEEVGFNVSKMQTC